IAGRGLAESSRIVTNLEPKGSKNDDLGFGSDERVWASDRPADHGCDAGRQWRSPRDRSPRGEYSRLDAGAAQQPPAAAIRRSASVVEHRGHARRRGTFDRATPRPQRRDGPAETAPPKPRRGRERRSAPHRRTELLEEGAV